MTRSRRASTHLIKLTRLAHISGKNGSGDGRISGGCPSAHLLSENCKNTAQFGGAGMWRQMQVTTTAHNNIADGIGPTTQNRELCRRWHKLAGTRGAACTLHLQPILPA